MSVSIEEEDTSVGTEGGGEREQLNERAQFAVLSQSPIFPNPWDLLPQLRLALQRHRGSAASPPSPVLLCILAQPDPAASQELSYLHLLWS